MLSMKLGGTSASSPLLVRRSSTRNPQPLTFRRLRTRERRLVAGYGLSKIGHQILLVIAMWSGTG